MNAILSELNQHEMSDEIRHWVNTALKNQLKAPDNRIDLGEAEHMLDFLKSPAAPKRLRKASVAQIKRAAEQWTRSLQKHGADIGETEADTEVVLELRNGLKLVRLIGEAAFKREGFLMRHCVGDYVNREGIHIYSIRDSKNMPHCTIQVTIGKGVSGEERIDQVKGKGNSSIHPNYIDAVLQSLQYLGMNVRSSELTYLGYNKVSDELLDFIMKNFKNVKTLTYKNEIYVFRHQDF